MKILKSRLPILLALFAMFALVLSGCGDSRPGKEVVQEALKKQASLNSYGFDGKLKLNLGVDAAALQADPQAGMFLEMLKNSELTYRGNASLEPFQMEVTLDAKVDMQGASTTFSIPMIMNQDKMWIKVPALDMVPELAMLKGKYIELDYKELEQMAAAQGEATEMPKFDAATMKEQKEMTIKLTDATMKHYGPEYFVDAKKEEIPNFPADVKADRIVNLKVTNETMIPFLKTSVEKVIPEVLTVLAESPSMKEALAQDAQAIEQFKTEAKDFAADVDKNEADIKSALNIKKANYFLAIDKDKNIPFQLMDWDVTISDKASGQSFDIGLIFEQKSSNFDTAPKWELPIPKGDEVITFTDLMQGNF
ncbi:hypothetical protein [Brevibacillus daliensis]|uniref:hypothetical protein n=1 Tax=Brevibacillus daliensis TaxID=2892995 RepID=UPI001E565811|nr:hypothetical protein [Brevibacillus daliensis]